MATSQQEEKSIIETMSDILGSKYQIISQTNADPVVIAKLPDEDLAPKNSVFSSNHGDEPGSVSSQPNASAKPEKSKDDYMFQFYLGSISVVGLFILFRMIQKSK